MSSLESLPLYAEVWERILEKKAEVDEALQKEDPDSPLRGMISLLVEQAGRTNKNVEELCKFIQQTAKQFEEETQNAQVQKERTQDLIVMNKDRLGNLLERVDELVKAHAQVSSTGIYVYLC